MDAGHVADEADPPVAVGDEVGHGVAGTAEVVGEDDVGVDPARRTVHEHRRHARLQLRLQITVVVTGRDDHETVHAPGAQRQHQFLLALGVLGAGAVDEQGAVGSGHLLHRAAEGAVERVGEVLQDQADAGGTALAQDTRAVVAAEAEGLDGLPHPVLRLGCDPRFAVDHPGDRLEPDAGPRGHVLHGRTVAVPGRGEAVCSAVGVGHDTASCPVVDGDAAVHDFV